MFTSLDKSIISAVLQFWYFLNPDLHHTPPLKTFLGSDSFDKDHDIWQRSLQNKVLLVRQK